MSAPFVFRLHSLPPATRSGVAKVPVSTWKAARREARRAYRMLRRHGAPPAVARHAIVTMLVCGGSRSA